MHRPDINTMLLEIFKLKEKMGTVRHTSCLADRHQAFAFTDPGSTICMPTLCQMVPDVEGSPIFQKMKAGLEQKLRITQVSLIV